MKTPSARATYRLQFHKGFRLADATQIVPYLASIGISHVYASPLFTARPGSTHGYDVCRWDQLNPEIGTEKEFELFSRQLSEHGLFLLLDIVPNHMAADLSNPWWCDVLKNGEASSFAKFFDIDWGAASNPRKVVWPILGDESRALIQQEKIKLKRENEDFFLEYFEKNLPVSQAACRWLETAAGPDRNGWMTFANRPDAEGWNRREKILSLQHYELAYWKSGLRRINYRRFFDVSELAAVRMEDPEVFAATHRLLFDWIERGKVHGLRIDHPDGLRDPVGYFRAVQDAFGRVDASQGRLYVLVEKILSGQEVLPPDWPVHGTTGYDYLNQVNGVFIDATAEAAFVSLYRDFTGDNEPFDRVVHESKKWMIEKSFEGELSRLVKMFQSFFPVKRPDLEVKAALVELIAALPVYRTYVTDKLEKLSVTDAAVLEEAFMQAGRILGALPSLGHLRKILILEAEEAKAGQTGREFVMRFQQLTGPVTAKGLEDTTFYRFVPFISLNEVGGNPARFGVTVPAFHEFNRRLQQSWPRSLLATATHDTKRGEDVRARLNVLSEMPGQWRKIVLGWHARNAERRGIVSAHDEYLFYQMLVGTIPTGVANQEGWNDLTGRLTDYMLKAAREAKRLTSWTEPDLDYEGALKKFVASALDRESNPGFVEEAVRFAAQVGWFGYWNSLAQTALKLTCPGVPDIYQGTELWDFNMVDPDNRRPVDFNLRQRMLSDRTLQPIQSMELQSGAIKLDLIAKLLRFRKEHPDLFLEGDYSEVPVTGQRAGQVIAFTRRRGRSCLLVVVPRLWFQLTGGRQAPPLGDLWGDTRMNVPSGNFQNVLTGESVVVADESIPAGKILRSFPIGVLASP